jgi:hypothetical protein
MIVRCCAEFRSSLPEECGTIGTDGDKKYAGPVAVAISEMLRGLGYDADPPADVGVVGWAFEVRVKGYPSGSRCWCSVTLIDEYYLVFENDSWWDRVREVYPAPYIEALRALAHAMAIDPRFSDVRWYVPKDAVRGLPGSRQPVDD